MHNQSICLIIIFETFFFFSNTGLSSYDKVHSTEALLRTCYHVPSWPALHPASCFAAVSMIVLAPLCRCVRMMKIYCRVLMQDHSCCILLFYFHPVGKVFLLQTLWEFPFCRYKQKKKIWNFCLLIQEKFEVSSCLYKKRWGFYMLM